MRLAMKHGCSLVPVFSFNECNTYKQVSDDFPGVGWLKRKWQSVLGISFPLVTNIFPRRTSVTTVVGRPLHVQQVADQKVSALMKLVKKAAASKQFQEALVDASRDTYRGSVVDDFE